MSGNLGRVYRDRHGGKKEIVNTTPLPVRKTLDTFLVAYQFAIATLERFPQPNL